MFLSLILIYLTIAIFCSGVLMSIYGKWALNDDCYFGGYLTSFVGFFLFVMTFCFGDSSSTYEITNYCTLSREFIEESTKKGNTEIISLKFVCSLYQCQVHKQPL